MSHRKTNANHWCQFCEKFVYDNALSRKRHDNSKKHKDAVRRFMYERSVKHRQEQKEKDALDREMEALHRAADRAVRADVRSGWALAHEAPTVAQYAAVEAAGAHGAMYWDPAAANYVQPVVEPAAAADPQAQAQEAQAQAQEEEQQLQLEQQGGEDRNVAAAYDPAAALGPNDGKHPIDDTPMEAEEGADDDANAHPFGAWVPVAPEETEAARAAVLAGASGAIVTARSRERQARGRQLKREREDASLAREQALVTGQAAGLAADRDGTRLDDVEEEYEGGAAHLAGPDAAQFLEGIGVVVSSEPGVKVEPVKFRKRSRVNRNGRGKARGRVRGGGSSVKRE